jgi:hypothetical protein
MGVDYSLPWFAENNLPRERKIANEPARNPSSILGLQRFWFWSGLGGFLFAGAPNSVANTVAFTFEAVHQTASPNELNGKKAETEKNYQESWTGSDQHYETCQQQSESSDDKENAANLLNRSKDHSCTLKTA